MICPVCGKQMNDAAAFCTECGALLQQAEQVEHAAQMGQFVVETNNRNTDATTGRLLAKVNGFIDAKEAVKLNKCLSLTAIVGVVMLRLFGFWLSALLIAVINGYFIFREYKTSGRIDRRMYVWTVGAFLIWLIMFI